MGVNTGTNRSRGGLLVQDNNTATPEDTVFAYGVREIIVTTGTLTNNGQGTVTITTGGGSGSGSVTSVATAGTVNGLTLTGGTITVAGTITLGGTLAINNADWSGTALSATNGGTGLTTYTTGDIIYSSAANTLSKLPIGTTGQVLKVSATGIPAWDNGGGGLIDATGVVFTPQASNPETTNPLDTIWLNSETGHLMRGNRDTESTVHFNVRNDEGATIPLGAPLYSKGEIGGSDRIKVGIADASDPAKMPAIGVAMEELNTNSGKDGNMILTGVLNENITITGVTERDIIYVAPHGGTAPYLTVTRPTSGSHLVQNVGVCVRQALANISQGIYVSAIGRTNDIPNGVITTNSADADYVYIDDGNTFKKITPADLGIGGGGGGTVNPATQYQVAYYATTGTAVSGDANLTFNPAAGTTATFVYVGGGPTASTQAHPVNLIQETATTPALGFGVGLDYSIKPAAGEVLLGRMEVQEQAVVATNETADFVFKLRNTSSDPATTNEVFRMTATGGFKSTPSAAGGTVLEVGAGVGGTVTVGGTGSLTTLNGSISAAGTNGAITAETNLVANTGNIVASVGQVNAPNETINAGKGMTIAAGDLTWGGGSLKQNDPAAYGGVFNDQEFVTRICGTLTTPSAIPDGSDLDEVTLLGATWTLEGGSYTMGSAGGGIGYDGTYAGATSTFVSYGTSVTVNLTDPSVFDAVVCGGAVSATGFTIAEYEPFTMQVIGKTAVGNLTIQVFGNAVPL